MINLQDLKTELLDPKYDGLSHAEALDLLVQGETALGRIEGPNRRNLITLVNSGLRRRLLKKEKKTEAFLTAELAKDVPDDTVVAQTEGLLTLIQAFVDTLEPILIMQPEFSINLGDATVKGMFDAGVAAGLVTTEEKTTVETIATYSKPSPWAGTTEKDVFVVRNDLEGTGVLTYTYVQDMDYVVNSALGKTNVAIKLPVPATYDMTVKVKFKGSAGSHTDPSSYVEYPQEFTLRIPAGKDSVGYVFSTVGMPRFLKTIIELDRNAEATVETRGV